MEVIDVRNLPHSERPSFIFKILEEKGEIDIIVEVNPVPLIQMLIQKGYKIESIREGDHWRVKIRR